jgi:hypothetical protein
VLTCGDIYVFLNSWWILVCFYSRFSIINEKGKLDNYDMLPQWMNIMHDFSQRITESHHSSKYKNIKLFLNREIWVLSCYNKLLPIRIDHTEPATLMFKKREYISSHDLLLLISNSNYIFSIAFIKYPKYLICTYTHTYIRIYICTYIYVYTFQESIPFLLYITSWSRDYFIRYRDTVAFVSFLVCQNEMNLSWPPWVLLRIPPTTRALTSIYYWK